MYRGFFINLNSNTQRRESLQQHLAEIGAAHRYERIEAVDGREAAHQYQSKLDPGNLGCWLSHLKLLNANRSTDCHLHVIEDDTVFSKNAVATLDAILNCVQGDESNWDVIFTDIYMPLSLNLFLVFSQKLESLKQSDCYELFDVQQFDVGATSSFLVNRRSIDKLANLLADKWSEAWPIDLYIRKLINEQALKAYVTLPFLTSISRHSVASDIRGILDRSHRVLDLYRQAFFKDANLDSLHHEMQELTKGAKVSTLTEIFANLFVFTQSDRFVRF